MIAPLLMMATLVAPQDPPSPHHLTPIPIINADFSGERNLSHYEPIEGSTSEASSPLSETTTLTLRDTPRPEPSAASPQAAIEVARERELRDRYFLSIEPGATASLLLEGPAGPIRLAPGARYECSWAEGSDPGTGAPRGEVSLRSATHGARIDHPSSPHRDPEGRWKRSRQELLIESDRAADQGDLLLCLHNPADADGPLLIDNLTLARIDQDPGECTSLFNGRDLTGWIGSDGTSEGAFLVEDGVILCNPGASHGNNLLTEDVFGDFILHFEFTVPPAGNNGIALRTPRTGDPAYAGFESQVLDTIHPAYLGIKPWQTHGSIYGIAPAKRGFQRPTGEWNRESIHVKGREVVVILNGETILETNLDDAVEAGTLSGQEHPGLGRTSGHLGFCGHGHPVAFRNIRIKPLDPRP